MQAEASLYYANKPLFLSKSCQNWALCFDSDPSNFCFAFTLDPDPNSERKVSVTIIKMLTEFESKPLLLWSPDPDPNLEWKMSVVNIDLNYWLNWIKTTFVLIWPLDPDPNLESQHLYQTVPVRSATVKNIFFFGQVFDIGSVPASASCLELYLVKQGWKFMSCSHCQELCQQPSWHLISCTRVDNQ